MSDSCYTAVTFAPVQGFIEKSRKLRDLYGSSFILSYLAEAICRGARRYNGVDEISPESDPVVSPALINVIQGTPNQIILRGHFPKQELENDFNQAWSTITQNCQLWLERNCQEWVNSYYPNWVELKLWYPPDSNQEVLPWNDGWNLWTNHAWEFFWETGKSVTEAREALNEKKRWRAWTGVNWIGESSTLSGSDGVAYPGMALWVGKNPAWTTKNQREEIEDFYQYLSSKIGERFLEFIAERIERDADNEKELVARYGSGFILWVKEGLPKLKVENNREYQERVERYGSAIINPEEELSIPELVKRLIVLEEIADKISQDSQIEIKLQEVPTSYRDLNRLNNPTKSRKKKAKKSLSSPTIKQLDIETDNRWTGWFQGDGDRAGDYLQHLKELGKDEAEELHNFSLKMRQWGEELINKPSLPKSKGRIIYAGGDDLFGVFYRTPPEAEYLEPLIKTLSQTFLDPLPETEVEKWSEKLQDLEQKIKQKGLHKSLKIPAAVRQKFAEIIRSDPPVEELKYAGLKAEEAAVLFEKPILTATECLEWLYKFKQSNGVPDNGNSELWQLHQQPITVSLGLVWAAPNVPQRDIIQHCREAESDAKKQGRDRLVIRVLFNGGNYLQWGCPWWLLPQVMQGYTDRNGGKNWGHIYEDVATLESRHAFSKEQHTVALGLFGLYFPKQKAILANPDNSLNTDDLWNVDDDKSKQRLKTGILGDIKSYQKEGNDDQKEINQALNNWVINLAKVGFHLCQ